MNKDKKILDSVHGYITISEDICDTIVDTVQFQRLRRVEQMSIRSLFPCARHDRFTHSLGVYHIGRQILENIKNSKQSSEFPVDKENVFESYLLACLLHDVGHSPFSHTFEDSFSKSTSYELLLGKIPSKQFKIDSKRQYKKAASHELMSAYIASTIFKNVIKSKKANIELVARMIIGCKYTDVSKSFENAFIELIHGDIIDADGLDYVKRDSWASGYSSATVDVERLIKSINIYREDKDANWEVCYSTKALNEIESVLTIKTFQSACAVTHHIVVLEQHILKEAMKSSALKYVKCHKLKKRNGDDALKWLCNVETLRKPVPKNPLVYPCDDDFVSLMKKHRRNGFVRQWLSRKYDYSPLWKSKAEFYLFFPMLRRSIYNSKFWLFSDNCKEYIKNLYPTVKEVLILSANSKDRRANAKVVNFLIDDKIVPYNTVVDKNETLVNSSNNPFYYIYIPKSNISLKDKIVDSLKEKVNEFAFLGDNN